MTVCSAVLILLDVVSVVLVLRNRLFLSVRNLFTVVRRGLALYYAFCERLVCSFNVVNVSDDGNQFLFVRNVVLSRR